MKCIYSKVLTIFILMAATTTMSYAVNWTEWEKKNSVAKYKDWIVINQDGQCYLKQSYDDPNHMELHIDRENVSILTPFFKGMEKDGNFWFDDGKKHTLPIRANKLGFNPINLGNHLSSVKSSIKMYVEAYPTNSNKQVQSFSLLGFTKAYNFMCKNKICELNEGQKDSKNLSVNIIIKNETFVLHGDTTLPDGMILMISISHIQNKYNNVEKTVVNNGRYQVSFGKKLPKGKYAVKITSPFLGLQPNDVKRKLGDKGINIPHDIRKKDYGEYGVHYKVVRNHI